MSLTRVSFCVEKQQEHLRLYGYEKTVKSDPVHTIRTDLSHFTNSGHHEGKFACWTQDPKQPGCIQRPFHSLISNYPMSWAGKDCLPVKIHYYGKISNCSYFEYFFQICEHGSSFLIFLNNKVQQHIQWLLLFVSKLQPQLSQQSHTTRDCLPCWSDLRYELPQTNSNLFL